MKVSVKRIGLAGPAEPRLEIELGSDGSAPPGVSELKGLVAEKSGIPEWAQRLFWQGRLLRGPRTLEEQGVPASGGCLLLAVSAYLYPGAVPTASSTSTRAGAASVASTAAPSLPTSGGTAAASTAESSAPIPKRPPPVPSSASVAQPGGESAGSAGDTNEPAAAAAGSGWEVTEAELSLLSPKELKQRLAALGESWEGCTEKIELVRLLWETCRRKHAAGEVGIPPWARSDWDPSAAEAPRTKAPPPQLPGSFRAAGPATTWAAPGMGMPGIPGSGVNFVNFGIPIAGMHAGPGAQNPSSNPASMIWQQLGPFMGGQAPPPQSGMAFAGTFAEDHQRAHEEHQRAHERAHAEAQTRAHAAAQGTGQPPGGPGDSHSQQLGPQVAMILQQFGPQIMAQMGNAMNQAFASETFADERFAAGAPESGAAPATATTTVTATVSSDGYPTAAGRSGAAATPAQAPAQPPQATAADGTGTAGPLWGPAAPSTTTTTTPPPPASSVAPSQTDGSIGTGGVGTAPPADAVETEKPEKEKAA
eukprot:gnl/TRDRNA2_/TRDRNA2_80670_c0_seq1.p1 gnl/TRDRNA2_/TRDRNA2_80670_c0~~gnl/TRDRNA2_/TRDRNA2_80670_c0_seq1.p1  ORF type:complete len:534 (+),score=96.52 gnl/TRDRNA2_/TRDRNA2_80670_c0_seq1:59-1660(+)